MGKEIMKLQRDKKLLLKEKLKKQKKRKSRKIKDEKEITGLCLRESSIGKDDDNIFDYFGAFLYNLRNLRAVLIFISCTL